MFHHLDRPQEETKLLKKPDPRVTIYATLIRPEQFFFFNRIKKMKMGRLSFGARFGGTRITGIYVSPEVFYHFYSLSRSTCADLTNARLNNKSGA